MNNKVYEIITERIIKKMEQGIVPWRKPWSGSANSGAYNVVSKQPYSLINQLLLNHDSGYLTFKQVKQLKGTVNKGAKSEIVVFWKQYNTGEVLKDKNGNDLLTRNGEKQYKTIPLLRYYNVFWVGDTSLADKYLNDEKRPKPVEPLAEAEKVISNYLKHNTELKIKRDKPSDEAYYTPTGDYIVLPCLAQYRNPNEFYSTAFHEMTHSTGAKHRLDRLNMQAHFGNEEYSKEELVAEIGSAYLMSYCGIETDDTFKNSIGYLQSWIRALKNDPKMIVFASAQSEKAVNYILEGIEDYEGDTAPLLPSLVYPNIKPVLLKPKKPRVSEPVKKLAKAILEGVGDNYQGTHDDGTPSEKIEAIVDDLNHGGTYTLQELQDCIVAHGGDIYYQLYQRVNIYLKSAEKVKAWEEVNRKPKPRKPRKPKLENINKLAQDVFKEWQDMDWQDYGDKNELMDDIIHDLENNAIYSIQLLKNSIEELDENIELSKERKWKYDDYKRELKETESLLKRVERFVKNYKAVQDYYYPTTLC